MLSLNQGQEMQSLISPGAAESIKAQSLSKENMTKFLYLPPLEGDESLKNTPQF